MASYRGLGVQVRPARPQRPLGVALLAGIGVFGNLVALLACVGALWMLMRVSVEPSLAFGIYGLGAMLALIALWINWGFWEMVRSSWWANLGLTLAGAGLSLFALRYVPDTAAAIGQVLPQLAASSHTMLALGGMIALIAYHLVAVLYIFSIHATFGVGTKDERPLWEKVHRN